MINLQKRRTPLGNKVMRRLLWGRDALLKIPLINFAGDGLLLLVMLNLLRIEFLFVKGKNFAGDDLSVAACWG